ncbi:MAG: DUF3990 domain-containing protein [Lachnospiraceae bacterium]|nr:DUF3990 domain-containing protein [Lachnospiraceae bacterium]
MIVYHGTTEIIKHPEVRFSKKYLDFGQGFYLTTFKEQAEKWAKRKGSRLGKAAIVNEYELGEFQSYRYLEFKDENEQWLDFVCACRKGEMIYQKYDIIRGNVADDDVFKTVDMYFRGLWSKEQTLKELRYYKMNDQICIVNQELIDKVLIYKESYEV